MGTLASELGGVAEGFTESPRVYVDANLPAGLVRFMRERLQWDVLFVIEEDELRRAADAEHFRLAAQLRRTLVTLDRDYLDDDRFPPGEGAGVLVLTAPDEHQFERLLKEVDRVLFRPLSVEGAVGLSRMPLIGRKLHVHSDWRGELVDSR
jgi:predicted nuclease of predicted toxin-antitoxin system